MPTDQEILATVKATAPLIDCLIEHESTYDCSQTGLAGEIGCLQFLPKTYADNCVRIYGFSDNINSLSNQVECAKHMIADDQVTQWTTWIYCTKYL